MEFSLLKQIVPNRFYLPSSFSTHPSHQPGFDCINPGIGNVVQPFSFFVPTFFQSNPNLKSKRIPDEAPVTPHIELEGKGNEIEETKPENVEKVDLIKRGHFRDRDTVCRQLFVRKPFVQHWLDNSFSDDMIVSTTRPLVRQFFRRQFFRRHDCFDDNVFNDKTVCETNHLCNSFLCER